MHSSSFGYTCLVNAHLPCIPISVAAHSNEESAPVSTDGTLTLLFYAYSLFARSQRRCTGSFIADQARSHPAICFGRRFASILHHQFDAPRTVIANDTNLRAGIIHENHDASGGGHLGRKKTFTTVSRDFFCPYMYK